MPILPMGTSLVAQIVRIHWQCGEPRFDSWVRKIPWKREQLPTPVFLPGESHGQKSLAGYSPWGCKQLDTIELHFHFHSILPVSPSKSWIRYIAFLFLTFVFDSSIRVSMVLFIVCICSFIWSTFSLEP